MNAHLSEGTLQRMLDGELAGPELGGVQQHLSGCPGCRAELRALEAAFATVALQVPLLDPHEVSLDLAHAAWRRRMRGEWKLHLRRQLPRAAIILLAVAGVASATVPGGPLWRWLESLRHEQPAAVASTETVPTGGPAAAGFAGVSIDPADGELTVVVERASRELRIRVRLADQPRMSVRGIGDAAAAQFSMGRGRVNVAEVGAGELEVVIPRTANRATISVDGRRFLLKDGETVHVLVPADSAGAEIVFPVRF
jgi:hypothetical protein